MNHFIKLYLIRKINYNSCKQRVINGYSIIGKTKRNVN